MKVKTSLTLSEDLLATIDKLAGRKVSRSAFIEQILRESLARRAQARSDAREVAAINRYAAQLKTEISDALSFQQARRRNEAWRTVPRPQAGG